ncbi:MAG: hypothetical protein JWO63_910 [Frankiales bacterium]|nr:hypothetical protein [Frankiales bacterium]
MSPDQDAAVRARLAWSRTILSALALAAVLVKLGLSRHRPAEVVVGGFALVIAGALVARLPGGGPTAGAARAAPLRMMVLAGLTAGCGALALGLALS